MRPEPTRAPDRDPRAPGHDEPYTLGPPARHPI